MYRVWIGKRESDILTYNYFDFSITYYGSNSKNNVSFCDKTRMCSSYSKDFLDFVVKSIIEIFNNKNKDVEFHFYNNVFAYKIINVLPTIKENVVNLNDINILNILRHKTLSRLWLNNHIDTPAFCLLSKPNCSIKYFNKKFGQEFNDFVIQKNYSGGGTGTYLINDKNEAETINKLNDKELYLVSPYYYPNQSLSCHIMIDKEKVIVLPISKQMISSKNNNLEYVGNKYIDYKSDISKKIIKGAKNLGHELQMIGYRGVCGFDFIIHKERLMLIEINPRYQGSSYVVNYMLNKNGLPSLFELNGMCFNDVIPTEIELKIQNMNTKYLNTYINFRNDLDKVSLKNTLSKSTNILFLDGCDKSISFEDNCYLLRYISPLNEFWLLTNILPLLII